MVSNTRSKKRIKHDSLLMVVVFLLSGFSTVWAQDNQADLDDEYRSGLLATYRATAGTTFQRVDSRLAFSWQQSDPDPRISGDFSATWDGYLMSQAQGLYRLAAHVQGSLTVELAGKTLLQGDGKGWMVSPPIELPFDWHPVKIKYSAGKGTGKLVLYWTGPGFQWEPIDPKQWYHDPKRTPKNRFDRGHQLVRALRCNQCHEIPGQPPTRLDPIERGTPGARHRLGERR